MNKGHADDSKRYIQSVARALEILEFVAGCRGGTGLTAISKGAGLSKSTTHGLIATLEQWDYIRQNPQTGEYSLGLKLFELGQAYSANIDLRQIALPHLQELSETYQETIHIAVLSGEDVVYIEKVDGPLSIGIRSNIGGRNPAYCTGVGKVLLSGLPDEKLTSLYGDKPLKKYTVNTVCDLSDLKKQISNIRKCGFGVDMEEIELGLRCVAAPVKDSSGVVIAAISISGPANRLSDDKLADLAAKVSQAAGQISARLGYKDWL